MKPFIKGMDVSSLKELEQLGARYYQDGQEKGLLEILKSYGANSIRLRLWNDPYSESGVPYGAGTNDMKTTLELGRRVLDMGFGFLLDLHYSDFWADPGKQRVPKAWRGMEDVYKRQVEIPRLSQGAQRHRRGGGRKPGIPGGDNGGGNAQPCGRASGKACGLHYLPG